jgi:hypothetical protein
MTLRSIAVASIAVLATAAAAVANAGVIRFAANLSPLNETPVVVGSSGTGFVTVDYDDLAHTLQVQATWSGLSGPTTVSHIHCCALPTTTAGVAVTPSTLPSFPAGLTAGSYSSPLLSLTAASTFTSGFVNNFAGGILANAEGVFIQNMKDGKAYFNIHTTFAPAGEIRGTLVQVPEPGMLSLLGLGMLGMLLTRRRSGNGRRQVT